MQRTVMGMNVKKYHVLYLVMSLFTLIAVVMVCFLFMLNRSINVIDQRSREKQATGAQWGTIMTFAKKPTFLNTSF